MLLLLYKHLMTLAAPFLRWHLQRRIRTGKEDAARVAERWGTGNITRPPGKLLWCHAASVGESLALVALIKKLKQENPELTILLTTGTVTSARLIHDRIGDRIIHQYVPLDVPRWVGRFLRHWQPDMALFVESELWPNILQGLQARSCPAVLINARLSPNTYRKWKKYPKTIARILSCFNMVIAQSRADEEAYYTLGHRQVIAAGNLKFASELLPHDAEQIAALKSQIGARPVWMLASSHDGEDQIAIQAHAEIKKKFPNALTIIAPRHKERAKKIVDFAIMLGMKTGQKSKQDIIAAGTDIYLVDTMGELGNFFASTNIVCVGGSLVPKGGHNLIEPAQFGCALLHGPYMTASPLIRDIFHEHNATTIVADSNTLALALKNLWSDPQLLQQKQAAAATVINSEKSVLDDIFHHLSPLFSRAGIVQANAS